MGLFSGNKKEINWINLTGMDQLNEIEKASLNKPQLIFKHSTTCSISRMARGRMEEGLYELEKICDVYYLDLLSYRSISNAVADKWKVQHESPQILIIKNGESVYDASHNMISINDIKENLK